MRLNKRVANPKRVLSLLVSMAEASLTKRTSIDAFAYWGRLITPPETARRPIIARYVFTVRRKDVLEMPVFRALHKANLVYFTRLTGETTLGMSRKVAPPEGVSELYGIMLATEYWVQGQQNKNRQPASIHLTRSNLFHIYNGRCAFCGAQTVLKPKNKGYVSNLATIDHLYPLSLGGENRWENVVLACSKCNLEKGNMTPEDWFRKKGLERVTPIIPSLRQIEALEMKKEAEIGASHSIPLERLGDWEPIEIANCEGISHWLHSYIDN